MIYWAPFLHFYQPPIQFHHILKKICNESYRPLIKIFKDRPNSKVTINMSAVLTESLCEHGYEDIIEGIRDLAKNKQLEFVESAKYHPILPYLPKEEIIRQINLNNKTNQKFFQKFYKPRGFFPPEMAYGRELTDIIRKMGYEWILLSGAAHQDKWPMDFISRVASNGETMNIFYRDDVLSNRISFHDLDSKGFIKNLVSLHEGSKSKDIYVITAMDSETFGHHIHNWEKIFLGEVYETIDTLDSIYTHSSEVKQKRDLADAHKNIFSGLKEIPQIKVVKISELLDKFPLKKTKPALCSSWSTSKEEISSKNYYPLWKDPTNRIHELQWEHLSLCFDMVKEALLLKDKNKETEKFSAIARGLMDRAVHSCQFWWANKHKGLWDINLVNKGLILQEEAMFNAYKTISVSGKKKDVKKDFYHKLLAARDVAIKIRDILVQL